ncbi:MAG: glycosyl hydrolase [Chryseosolibacter sp.]
MKKLFLLFLVAFYVPGVESLTVYAQTGNTYQALSKGFVNPPNNAYPSVYHWWLGGNVDTVRLKEELLSFKKAGISGFTIFEIGSRDTVFVKSGPAYLSKESLEVIKFAVDEAGKLGLDVGLNTASSWNAGGTWVTPEHAAKSIYYSRLKINGDGKQKNRLPFPEIPKKDPWGKTRLIEYGKDGKPVFYQEIAVLAVPSNTGSQALDTASVINVSQHYNPKTETLDWKAPAGEWEILRYICSNSGENLVLPSKHSAGPIVDHYDAAATEFHFTYIINKLQSALGDLRKTALKSLYMASYEMKGFTWTTGLPAEFKKINGYDIAKLLPALFDEKLFAPQVQANFRADFQRTLSELMINNFYRKSREVCNKYGLKNNSEAGGPGLPLHNVPVEPIKALGSLDIPRGEFWIHHGRFNEKGIDIIRVVKEISAASHIYNRRIVELEAFTSFQQWGEGPFQMKPSGDRAFAEGMNKVVVHGSTHNPPGTGYPGIVYHAGTHYNDKRVWWPKVKPFNDYLARISYILQEGDFVADVLYYYGDTIPNYGGHKNSRFTAGPGYDYEIVNTEILKEAVVKNKKVVLPRNNAQFSVLALTDEDRINPEVLLKIQELASQGATIVGAKPKTVSGYKVDPKLPGIIDRLWLNVEKSQLPGRGGKVYSNVEASDMLASMNVVPDFSYPGKEFFELDYVHYAKNDLDFYFVRNTTSEWISRNCSFRQKNRIPEIWNPVTGEIVPVAIYNQDTQYVNLPLSLPPYGSLFVVFKDGKQTAAYAQIRKGEQPPLLDHTKDGIYLWEEGTFDLGTKDQPKAVKNDMNVQHVDGAWEVFFPEGWGAPRRAIFPQLISWTESDQEGIKYFSGIATYKKTFQYEVNADALKKKKLYLDLGDLSHVGEVWLNEKPLGITWAKPYRFDVTGILKPGDNTLVIEIANTWSNRLVGDAISGGKFTRTNITNTNVFGLNHTRVQWKEVPLIRSGLLGPVKVYTIKPVE